MAIPDTTWIASNRPKPSLFPGFSADDFRDGIRTAMLLAYPASQEMRPLFHFPDTQTVTPADDSGIAYDWTATPVGPTPKADLRVLCLVDAHPVSSDEETVVGPFNNDRAIIYFFEDEWARAKTFNSVTIGMSIYDRVKRLDDVTLAEVAMAAIEVIARDRS